MLAPGRARGFAGHSPAGGVLGEHRPGVTHLEKKWDNELLHILADCLQCSVGVMAKVGLGSSLRALVANIKVCVCGIFGTASQVNSP